VNGILKKYYANKLFPWNYRLTNREYILVHREKYLLVLAISSLWYLRGPTKVFYLFPLGVDHISWCPNNLRFSLWDKTEHLLGSSTLSKGTGTEITSVCSSSYIQWSCFLHLLSLSLPISFPFSFSFFQMYYKSYWFNLAVWNW
jgi:hypothetical protein